MKNIEQLEHMCLFFHAAWANPSMSGKSWRDPFLDSFSDTLKSCERDVRRLQRSKEKKMGEIVESPS